MFKNHQSKGASNDPENSEGVGSLLTCTKDEWDYWKALKDENFDKSLLFSQELEDMDMYDLASDDSFDLDLDDI